MNVLIVHNNNTSIVWYCILIHIGIQYRTVLCTESYGIRWPYDTAYYIESVYGSVYRYDLVYSTVRHRILMRFSIRYRTVPYTDAIQYTVPYGTVYGHPPL